MRDSGDRIRRGRTSPTSPRLVLRRVLVLAEGRQFREAAQVLQKLNCNSVAAVASELPLDFLTDGLPHSAQLLETFFNKLITSGQRPNINSEQVVWRLVKLFSSHDDPALKTKVSKLAKILLEYQPDFQRMLSARKRALDQAVQGLGCHGLTPDACGLTHLHVALKTELHNHIEAYKSALHRLDELGLAASDSKRPTEASHQRLLSLHYGDVQQRLIENKTLLTIMDKPCLKQLRPLLDTLASRVQNDKEALFCVSQIKRMHPCTEEKPVAALLMSFSKGCGALLELMQVSESPCHSDGYHSEPEADNDNEKDPVRAYAGLYHQKRPQTLVALDGLSDLKHATQLKTKILFSVIVLAIRSCKNLRDGKIKDALRALHIDVRSQQAQSLRNDIVKCFSSCHNYPLGDVETQVRTLVCGTLKEYKCLDSCLPLRQYISDATRVAWMLVNQIPPYELDTDFQVPIRFQGEKHQRHSSSDRTSDFVKSYIWPALILENNYVYKAIVVTSGSGNM